MIGKMTKKRQKMTFWVICRENVGKMKQQKSVKHCFSILYACMVVDPQGLANLHFFLFHTKFFQKKIIFL